MVASEKSRKPRRQQKRKGSTRRGIEHQQTFGDGILHEGRSQVLWSQPNKALAEDHLQDWIDRAEASGIKILKEFANTLRTHRRGIIAYYDHPISTGPLEGTNNKIKTLQRQAYGFRDRAFFILRIYALHTSRYELIG